MNFFPSIFSFSHLLTIIIATIKSNIENNANDNYNLKGKIEFNDVSLIYPNNWKKRC